MLFGQKENEKDIIYNAVELDCLYFNGDLHSEQNIIQKLIHFILLRKNDIYEKYEMIITYENLKLLDFNENEKQIFEKDYNLLVQFYVYQRDSYSNSVKIFS